MAVYYKFNLTTRILGLLESFQIMCLASDLDNTGSMKIGGIVRFPKKEKTSISIKIFINHFTAVLFFRKTKKSNFQESIYYHLGFMPGIIFKETTYRFYVAIMLIMSLSMILFETWNDA